MSDNEEVLQEELEEININKLLQAQIKLKAKEDFKTEEIEKRKSKNAPREFSAKIKPKKWKKPISLEIKNHLRRDPRFEDYTGEFKPQAFEKNFDFVEKASKEYVSKIERMKKNKKFDLGDKIDLLKKQENLVKGWIKKKEHDKLKTSVEGEIKKENKEREDSGKNKIYLKKSVLKKIIKKKVLEQKSGNKKELKKYLKKNLHRQALKNKKEERFSSGLTKI